MLETRSGTFDRASKGKYLFRSYGRISIRCDRRPLTSPTNVVCTTRQVYVDGVKLSSVIPVDPLDPKTSIVVKGLGKIDLSSYPGSTALPGGENGEIFENASFWLLNKQDGELVSYSDPEGRPTVRARLLAMGLPHNLISVGRLDFRTEGLLVFTNVGAVARFMEHPRSGFRRRYTARVWSRRPVDASSLFALRRGVKGPNSAHRVRESVRSGGTLDDRSDTISYRPIKAEIASKSREMTKRGDSGFETVLHVTVHEGKNREVRNALRAVGLHTTRLVRTHFGPFKLGSLRPGEIRAVSSAPLDAALPKWREAIVRDSVADRLKRNE